MGVGDVEEQPLQSKDASPKAPTTLGQAPLLLARFEPSIQLLILGALSIITACGFSALQEKVFLIPGFKFEGWMTFWTYVTFAGCGAAECFLTGQTARHAPLKQYALVSITAMAGTYITNMALKYVNYSTRIVFKSSRVLPVMAFRSLVVGQHYSPGQYCAGALLVTGIALFTLGDADAMPNFPVAGVLLISVALVCDALTANLEERWFFRTKVPCQHSEVMTYLSSFAAVGAGSVLLASGELTPALAHAQRNWQTTPSIVLFSLLGYLTVSLILMIIKAFGSTSAEIVKSLRKICQIVLSFLLFPKPLSWKHLLGGWLVAVALWWLQRQGRGGAGRQSAVRPSAAGAGK